VFRLLLQHCQIHLCVSFVAAALPDTSLCFLLLLINFFHGVSRPDLTVMLTNVIHLCRTRCLNKPKGQMALTSRNTVLQEKLIVAFDGTRNFTNVFTKLPHRGRIEFIPQTYFPMTQLISYYPVIYTWVSSLKVSQKQMFTYFSYRPSVLHASPISPSFVWCMPTFSGTNREEECFRTEWQQVFIPGI
jgi:hypothetical protein